MASPTQAPDSGPVPPADPAVTDPAGPNPSRPDPTEPDHTEPDPAEPNPAEPGAANRVGRWWRRRSARPDATGPKTPREVRPARPSRYVAGSGLTILAVTLLSLTVSLTVLSRLEERAAQQVSFDALRSNLARGTAPVSTIDSTGHVIADGTPIAQLNVPAIGLQQTVLFGTSGGVLMDGPGLRRDSVIPGQAGAAVILGRAWAYGGPFAHLASIPPGSTITVTTGQGVATYRTTKGPRYAGDPVPAPLADGQGRLTLVSAYGYPFVPQGSVRIDADLIGTAHPTPAHLSGAVLQPAEQAFGTDPGHVWALVLYLQLTVVLAVLAVVAWFRWGRLQVLLVFGPLLLWIGTYLSDEVARVLPNVL